MNMRIIDMFNAPRLKAIAVLGACLSSSAVYADAPDAYNVILKIADPTTAGKFVIQNCAQGGFTLDRTDEIPTGKILLQDLSFNIADCLGTTGVVELSEADVDVPPGVEILDVSTPADTGPVLDLVLNDDVLPVPLKNGDVARSVAGLSGRLIGGGGTFRLTFSLTLPTVLDANNVPIPVTTVDGNTFDFNNARGFTFETLDSNGDPVGTPVVGQYYVINTNRPGSDFPTLFADAAAVPEPTTLALLAGAACGLWVAQRRRRRIG